MSSRRCAAPSHEYVAPTPARGRESSGSSCDGSTLDGGSSRIRVQTRTSEALSTAHNCSRHKLSRIVDKQCADENAKSRSWPCPSAAAPYSITGTTLNFTEGGADTKLSPAIAVPVKAIVPTITAGIHLDNCLQVLCWVSPIATEFLPFASAGEGGGRLGATNGGCRSTFIKSRLVVSMHSVSSSLCAPRPSPLPLPPSLILSVRDLSVTFPRSTSAPHRHHGRAFSV